MSARRATVCVTFDNLGEVTDLERGLWPDEAPLGRHHSVTRALPRLLDLLDGAGLRATFFVEGLNTELYPDALRELDAAGHEVAYHGWRHERWDALDPARERELLERGVGRLEALGLRPAGFRPPGGELGPATLGALRELGFAYCSPAGEAVRRREGVALLPFRWELIDAFHYLPHFGGLRERLLGASDPLPPARLRAAVHGALDAAVERGAFVALLFHPFLADTEERIAVVRDALDRVRELVAEGAAACAPCRDVAAAT